MQTEMTDLFLRYGKTYWGGIKGHFFIVQKAVHTYKIQKRNAMDLRSFNILSLSLCDFTVKPPPYRGCASPFHSYPDHQKLIILHNASIRLFNTWFTHVCFLYPSAIELYYCFACNLKPFHTKVCSSVYKWLMVYCIKHTESEKSRKRFSSSS